MISKHKDYDDIPGTYVFDGRRSRMGYQLNKMCMSLNSADNRKELAADEDAYCDKYKLTPEQKEAVLRRDWLRMLQLGGNIYYIFKLASLTGDTMQHAGAQQTGMTVEEFRAMLLAAGDENNG